MESMTIQNGNNRFRLNDLSGKVDKWYFMSWQNGFAENILRYHLLLVYI